MMRPKVPQPIAYCQYHGIELARENTQEADEAAEVKQRLMDIREEHYEPAGYCRGTVTTKDGETYPIGDWSPQDEEPIPYKPVERDDLTDVKLTLIQTILGAHVPGKIALELIGQIKDMEVSA